jgi:protein-L-isoaspartate(D-aspartate) O-methyltransferase
MFNGATKDIFTMLRHQMVDRQIIGRGVNNRDVLQAMREVPRHLFVPEEIRSQSYEDTPLPIGKNQTISQPFIVAYMAEAAMISRTDKVLEIGTGCGYSAAILSKLADQVYTIERIPELAEPAKVRLQELGLENVHAFLSDGSIGLAQKAPFDAIICTAGAPSVPHSLVQQLAPGGRMIIPVSKGYYEELLRVTKTTDGEYESETLMDVRFVPLVGKEGYKQA